jgi:hypothetical protein
VALDPLREAALVAERLGDDRRRSRVCAVLANTHTLLGNVNEALESGTRAWTSARGVEDLELQVLSRACLQQAHYFHGDHERVVELGRENLAAVPAGRANEFFGQLAPAAIYGRYG